MAMKICYKCKESKSFDCFNKDKAKKDGFGSYCKKCTSENNYKYRLANVEKIKLKRQQYYLDNIDRLKKEHKEYRLANLEKTKERVKQFHLANPDRRKQYDKKYRLADIEKEREYRKRYRLANLEKGKEYRLANLERRRNHQHTRRVKKLSNGVFKISPKELKKLYSSSCFYCSSTENIHADHLVPISRGGQHSIGNLLPACQKCNLSKGSKLLIEWHGRKSNLK
jgi:5-methylcytosine-specific restriction endonuclease McrA